MTAEDSPSAESQTRPYRVASDVPFYIILGVIGGAYVLLIVGLLVADVAYMMQGVGHDEVVNASWAKDHPWLSRAVDNPIGKALSKPEIQYSVKLSLISCTITAILSLWVAVPVGYLLSRHQFFGRNLIDAILDIPIVLPPLVVGLSLLILFHVSSAATARGGRLPDTVRDPGAVHGGLCLCRADDAGHFRPDRQSPRAGRIDTRLHAGSGFQPSGTSRSTTRDADRRHVGLGSIPG